MIYFDIFWYDAMIYYVILLSDHWKKQSTTQTRRPISKFLKPLQISEAGHSSNYHTDMISRSVYYFRFCIFGCGYYFRNYPSNKFHKKIVKIWFLRFNIINKLCFEVISIKLLLMAPFHVWKVKIFAESTIQLSLLFRSVWQYQ